GQIQYFNVDENPEQVRKLIEQAGLDPDELREAEVIIIIISRTPEQLEKLSRQVKELGADRLLEFNVDENPEQASKLAKTAGISEKQLREADYIILILVRDEKKAKKFADSLRKKGSLEHHHHHH
uniref:NF7 n=1 Tax=synthetic construct TaxID=32630 RepID=UPI001AA00D30|nr:Chain A, NF7 [synthetic construct]